MDKFEKLLEERGVDYTIADSTDALEDLAKKLRAKMSLQKYIYGILGFMIFPLFQFVIFIIFLFAKRNLAR